MAPPGQITHECFQGAQQQHPGRVVPGARAGLPDAERLDHQVAQPAITAAPDHAVSLLFRAAAGARLRSPRGRFTATANAPADTAFPARLDAGAGQHVLLYRAGGDAAGGDGNAVLHRTAVYLHPVATGAGRKSRPVTLVRHRHGHDRRRYHVAPRHRTVQADQHPAGAGRVMLRRHDDDDAQARPDGICRRPHLLHTTRLHPHQLAGRARHRRWRLRPL